MKVFWGVVLISVFLNSSLLQNLVLSSKIGVCEMFIGVEMKVRPLFSAFTSISES